MAPSFIGFPGGDPTPEEQEQQQQAEEAWKNEAFRKQQERIAWRKRKASPDYVESPQERAKRRSKELMWNAASRRGVDDMYGEEKQETIEVILEKPLGIEFIEAQEGKIFIADIAEGYSAQKSGQLIVGDRLEAVDGQKVSGSFQQALGPIKEATGPVKLTFLRLV